MTTSGELPRGYGQIAYIAFTYEFHPGEQPAWSGLSDDAREHWDKVAQVIIDYVDRVPR